MKHAYLIMAHNEFYILEKLLKLLDDEKNDIYLHIDLKVKDFDYEHYKKIVKKSNLFFVERTDVRWGDYSQINCELLLIKEATKRKYSYYHLLSGVDLPLKSNEEIYNFFKENKGYEFIGFCKDNKKNEERIKYYHFFVRNIKKKIFYTLHFILLTLQKIFRINRLKNNDITIKKGGNWFSITHNFATYVIKEETNIKRHFKNSICGDEVFLQTLCYNSKFNSKVYRKYECEHFNIQRYIDWNRTDGKSPYTFEIEDKEMLLNSSMLFARKFGTKTKEQKQLVDSIYNTINKKNKK